MMFTPDAVWLLHKIDTLNNLSEAQRRLGWCATHRNIWAGSYDVWGNKQDEIDAIEIPRARMKDAENAGLITSEMVKQRRSNHIVWKLTDAGKALLEKENANL